MSTLVEAREEETVSGLILKFFDEGFDMRSVLKDLLQDRDGVPKTDINYIIQVWQAVNNLLDTRRTTPELRSLLLSLDKSMAESLIVVNRETHNFVLSEKKKSKRSDSKVFVQSYLLIGQDGMEMYISTKNMLQEIKDEQAADPKADAHVVSAKRIREMEDLVSDLERSMRAGITEAPSGNPFVKMWRRCFGLA